MKLKNCFKSQLNHRFYIIINYIIFFLSLISLLFWQLPKIIKTDNISTKQALAEDSVYFEDKFIINSLESKLSNLKNDNHYFIVHNFIQPLATLQQPIKKINKVIITAYSSSIDETDKSPFITALGTNTRDGIVATNFLKFGTKIQIPEVFGDKIFIVEDRMAPKNNYKIDVWFPSKIEALNFGVQLAEVFIVE